MPAWIVNTQKQSGSNDHEVHRIDTCTRLPLHQNRKSLGFFNACQDAVREATKTYADSNGCAYCAPACHTT